MYECYTSFNRYGDISKFITNPDLLQVTWDKCVYISNENDYNIAVELESCYAPFDEVKPFIAFLATRICELDNVVQRFNQKKRIKMMDMAMYVFQVPQACFGLIILKVWKTIPRHRKRNFSCELTAQLMASPTTGKTNSLSWV